LDPFEADGLRFNRSDMFSGQAGSARSIAAVPPTVARPVDRSIHHRADEDAVVLVAVLSGDGGHADFFVGKSTTSMQAYDTSIGEFNSLMGLKERYGV
jgi:hypothetical protein